MIAAWCCNTAWMISGWPEAAAFAHAVRRVAPVQERVLQRIVRANRASLVGVEHGFDEIRSIANFQRRVPIRDYQAFEPYLQRIVAGQQGVLTSEPVICLQPSGGTGGGRKLIPYTRSLRHEFQRALQVWIADLYQHCPGIRNGRAYWSISPALGAPERTAGGLPIGFEDDSAYLGGVARRLAGRMLVAPNWLARVVDLNSFRYLTLLHLLLAEDVSLISVWSPTFLAGLLRDLQHWRQQLAEDIASGQWPPKHCRGLPIAAPPPAASARRRDLLCDVLNSSLSQSLDARQLWPQLSLVSCWADEASAGPYEAVRARLPGVSFQPKGLLATEGFVSIPLWQRPAAALAVRSHFFEFVELDANPANVPRLAHELEIGGRYEVLLTTAGGLYRYRLSDQITVVDRWQRCPLVKFTGRVDGVSDLVGEKISAAHVARILEELGPELNFRPEFALLSPQPDSPPNYRLYLQDRRLEQKQLAFLAEFLEKLLAENPYYRQAVGLGQLAAADVVQIDPNAASMWDIYCEHRVACGQKLGDIKPTVLDRAFPARQLLDPWILAQAKSGAAPAQCTATLERDLRPHRASNADEPAVLPR